MILWLDGAHDPEENMRRDRALLAAAESGAEPVLRLFTFSPHGITLGASQTPERALDLERCRRDGVPWAVRPTGGRAIFHAEEWTYSLSAPVADAAWGGGSRSEAYLRMSRVLVASLARLGVPAALARPAPATGGAPNAACFASTSRHEIEVGRRKLVGSAQRRTQSGLLQQGSVLLGDGHLRLADYARTSDSPALKAELGRRAATAERWLGSSAPLSKWADALAAEIVPSVRLLKAADGLFLLTLEKRGSYTASLTQPEQ